MYKVNSKIKIVFVLWTLRGMGGSERVVYDIARKLDRERYSIIIISFEDGAIRNLYENIGLKVYVVSKKKRVDFQFIINLRKIFLDEDVDIVNPHHYGPLKYSFFATCCSKIKLVYTEHSRWQLEILNPMDRILNRTFLWRADAVVAISKQIEDYYKNRIKLKGQKIHFITNGIDIGIYQNANGDHLREELGINQDEKVLGMVGNIRPEKNHKLLISAFSTVVKEIENVRLILVGLDCMNGEIQRFASKIGMGERVLFLGKREDVPELLKIFDIYCIPSLYEGMPLTLLEAMTSGVPVIGADVLGINEVITDNLNGLLFPKNNEKKLAELIKRLLKDNDLRKRLIQEGKTFVDKYHNLDDKVNEYDELFQAVYQSKS